MPDSSLAKTDERSFKQRHPILVEALRKTYHFSKAQLLMSAILTLITIPLSKHYGLLTDVQSWATLKIVVIIYVTFLLLSALWNFVSVPLRRLEDAAQRITMLEMRPEPTAALSPVSTHEIEQVMGRFMDRFYDLKKLKPNVVESTPENVAAHYDSNGIIVKGNSPSGQTFRAFVLPLTNNSAKEKVAPLDKVSLRMRYVCYSGEQAEPLVMPRGAWLSESETEIDFPPDCLPRNAIIATITGEMNTVSAIRRDDSTYKGVIYTPEELRGIVFGVQLDFRAPSYIGSVQKRDYILEIIREPRFDIKLTSALLWKSEHLRTFQEEGVAFRTKIHEIWKDAHDQVPYPVVDTNRPIFYNYALSGSDQPEPFDFAAADARRRAIEQEQEGKLLDAIKDWESRAADFVKVYFGAEHRDQFVNTVPSFEAGFNRTVKPVNRFKILARSLNSSAQKDNAPELSYWTLYDAVLLRAEKLSSLREQLWKGHLLGK